ncbi:hypothetical protein MMC06_003406 [Schaereria dolodes]|nr:hypothetical protein [Schaereria dolodes]
MAITPVCAPIPLPPLYGAPTKEYPKGVRNYPDSLTPSSLRPIGSLNAFEAYCVLDSWCNCNAQTNAQSLVNCYFEEEPVSLISRNCEDPDFCWCEERTVVGSSDSEAAPVSPSSSLSDDDELLFPLNLTRRGDWELHD